MFSASIVVTPRRFEVVDARSLVPVVVAIPEPGGGHRKPSKPQPGRSWRQKLGSGRSSVRPWRRTIGRASKRFWQTVRRLRRGKQYSANTVYSAGGELLTSTEDIVGRWKKYFEDLLNPTDLAFQVDEIRPEYLKSLDVVGLSWLTRLCNIAWRLGTVPLEWQTGVVVPLFKKGDRRVCSNYRGSHFSASPGRSTPGYWRGEFRPIVDPRIQEEQCGFRPGRGTLDQLYTTSAGCLRVYGSLPNQSTCALWIWRRHSTVSLVVFCGECSASMGRGPGPLLARAVRSLYDRSRSLVRIAGSKSDLFPVHVGLRQGCPLSPVLFIIFMDRISRRSVARGRRESGLGTTGFHLCFLQMMLSCWLHQSSQDLQHVLERFAAECEAAGMRISTSKSEAMVLDRKRVACPLRVSGEVLLPQVEEFKYLGVLFTSEGKMDREIDRRIGAASASVMRSVYRTVVVKKELSRKASKALHLDLPVNLRSHPHLWS
ncbi:hypothetical protein L3Q82_018240 [Scortum barcoo]|uniref:Uncharacterized protein n=1 Tax=Scortum barcoo TaxID=214431 RepID=A0ACB8VIP4_9TELE|nr:hypothetical protein L3Q82_018240 [Scortum barcoo]